MSDPPPTRLQKATSLALANRLSLLGATVGAVAVVVSYQSGSMGDFGNTLQVMGFDPDRAALITALIGGAIAAGRFHRGGLRIIG